MRRATVALLLALAVVWATSGCGGHKARPAPTDSPAPPPGVSHPFQDALVGHGFSLKNMKITNENTATVDPVDGSHCVVVIQASDMSLSSYRVVSVGGVALDQLPPVMQSMINGVNIDADTLWQVIKGQRDLGSIHC